MADKIAVQTMAADTEGPLMIDEEVMLGQHKEIARLRAENEKLHTDRLNLTAEIFVAGSREDALEDRIAKAMRHIVSMEKIVAREEKQVEELRARLQAPLPEEVTRLRDMLVSYAPDPEEEAEIVALLERLARSAENAQLVADLAAERDGNLALRRQFGALENETMFAFIERLIGDAQGTRRMSYADLIARARSRIKGEGESRLGKLIDDLANALECAERAEQDARRHRWLRMHSFLYRGGCDDLIEFGAGFKQTKPEMLDAVIDAAIAKEEERG